MLGLKFSFHFNPMTSAKEFFYVFLFALFMSVCMTIFAVKSFVDVRDYVGVVANITDEYRTNSMTGNNESDGRYIIVEYEYSGKSYRNEVRVSTFSMKHAGDSVNIRINPSNPDEVDDSWYRHVATGMGFMSGLIAVVCFNGYRLRKKEPLEHNQRIVEKY